jgi:hypothetical protein
VPPLVSPPLFVPAMAVVPALLGVPPAELPALLLPPLPVPLPLAPATTVDVLPAVDIGEPPGPVDELQPPTKPSANTIAHPNESERIMCSV